MKDDKDSLAYWMQEVETDYSSDTRMPRPKNVNQWALLKAAIEEIVAVEIA